MIRHQCCHLHNGDGGQLFLEMVNSTHTTSLSLSTLANCIYRWLYIIRRPPDRMASSLLAKRTTCADSCALTLMFVTHKVGSILYVCDT